MVFHFCLEKYLQRTKERTNKDRHENNKEKITCDLKVTEDLENSREISVDEISTIAQETDNVEDQSQCELENSNDSVKKKPKNEIISKKENQKTKMEQKKKEGMIIYYKVESHEILKNTQ